MLIPGNIPKSEPDLRVGIILPEDKIKSIKIFVPEGETWKLESDQSNAQNIKKCTLNFDLRGDNSVVSEMGKAKVWKISPVDTAEIGPGSGLRVEQVVAGRGFHWQKMIAVTLPGTIEIKSVDNALVLINELPIEQYLMCVATSEMGAECPLALLEAQVIAARAWMLANVEQKHIRLGMDVCNDDCCQRYQGTTHLSQPSILAVQNTFGKVLMYDEQICDARYSKSCGGIMETFGTIWPGTELPYLNNITDSIPELTEVELPLANESAVRKWIDSVPHSFCSSKMIPEDQLKKYLGSVDNEGRYFRWQIKYTNKELTELLNSKLSLKAAKIDGLEVVSRGGSGRLSRLRINYADAAGSAKFYLLESEFEIRRCLHAKFLYSSCIYIDQKNDTFDIHGAGWGHGVGLCQIGALGMSLNNYNSEQIVYHYYPGSRLQKLY